QTQTQLRECSSNGLHDPLATYVKRQHALESLKSLSMISYYFFVIIIATDQEESAARHWCVHHTAASIFC
ncbi:hypothetical protein, partial [Nitrosomonas sp.]|uniref:hypothetical protein n=2 Tax=Nitrosomonas sp. TaxID=42353 RepID=UPI0037C960C0